MNAEQHTPGPWFVDEDNRPDMSWNRHIYTKTERATAICFMAHSSGRNEARDRANARLIAAAPEMLAALGAMLTHMGMDEDEWNKPTFDQARTAIAKATGGAA